MNKNNNNSNNNNNEEEEQDKTCKIDSEGFKIPYMIEYDCSKLMINFMWVTVEQLVSCGEILNAIKCLESLIQFGEEEDFNHSRSHVLLGSDEMMEYEIRDKTIYNQEEEKKRAKKRYKRQGESKDILKYRLSSLEEAMSRIKLAELLFHYTHNLDDARFNLEKASLLLSADKQSRRSMELYCKLSFFLIEIFQDGGALNLAKQEIKKSLRYSRVLSSNEWMLYFLIKESYIILKDCSIVNTSTSTNTTTTTNNNSNNNLKLLSLSFKSLDTAILIVNQNLKGNSFLNVLLNTIKCHYSLMFFDYSKLEEMFAKCNTHLQVMNEQVLQFNQDASKVPEFFNYLMDGFKSTNLIIQFSRTNEIKIRDTILSYKQLKVYNNMVYIIYKIRIGSFKSIDSNILNLQIDLQELFNYLSIFNDVNTTTSGTNGTTTTTTTTTTVNDTMGKKKDILPIPIFNFIYGPHYLSCICYLICAIHSRALGEMEKSMYCFDKSQQLIDSQLLFIYSSSNSNPTPQQMKESRALVRLKFIVYENLFYIKVTAMDLQGAFNEIVNCCDVYKCYPGLFTDGAESTIHYMSSLFQQSCGNYQLAKDHLSLAIKKCTRFDTQIQCIIALVFLNIYSGQKFKASTLIQDYLSPLSKHPQLILRCTSLLLEGIILISNINGNGNGNDDLNNHYNGIGIGNNNQELAKNKFRECLLLSNNEIGHAQLTSNILNQLAKLYISLFNQKTDSIPNQTEQSIRSMLDSSLSLGTILNDLNGKTSSLNILSKLNNNENENDIKLEIDKLLNTRNSIVDNFNSKIEKMKFLSNLLQFGILHCGK